MRRCAFLILLCLPTLAHAHLVSTGIGPFYDGLAHLFVSLQDLLFCLGVGLLAGLSGKETARSTLLYGAVAWIAGGVIGLYVGGEVTTTFAAPVMLLLVGVFVALDLRLPGVLTISAVSVATAIHGYLNGVELAPVGIVGVFGVYFAFLTVALLIAASVAGLRAMWARTAARVAGSWIGAAGLLLLGWTLRTMSG